MIDARDFTPWGSPKPAGLTQSWKATCVNHTAQDPPPHFHVRMAWRHILQQHAQERQGTGRLTEAKLKSPEKISRARDLIHTTGRSCTLRQDDVSRTYFCSARMGGRWVDESCHEGRANLSKGARTTSRCSRMDLPTIYAMVADCDPHDFASHENETGVLTERSSLSIVSFELISLLRVVSLRGRSWTSDQVSVTACLCRCLCSFQAA